MSVNGQRLDLESAPIIRSPDFWDKHVRELITTCKAVASKNPVPLSDPASILILSVVLDKLDAMEKRLDAIDKAKPKVIQP